MSYESLVHIDVHELQARVDGKYEGERNTEGERHGYGKAVQYNGDTYEGEYQNGRRHGYGKYKFLANKSRYEGDYKRNKRNGKGIMYHPDGSMYDGDWVNNKRTGNGKYIYVNGDTYEGGWNSGRKHGQGIYVYKDLGFAYKGMWECGKFEGDGQLHTKCYVFSGRFRDEQPRGPGSYYFNSGCQQVGAYISKKNVPKDLEGDGFGNNYVPVWICTALQSARSLPKLGDNE